jgi:mitogen-activated protein kinase kinase
MLLAPKKNRNKKGLLLSSPDIITTADDTSTKPVKSYGPVEVTGSSRSSRASTSSTASSSNSTTSPVPSDSTSHTTSSSRASYHNTLSEQLATLELGVEFKLDLRSEDLQVLNEIGSGNGGTVSKCLHLPTKAIMAKKVSSFSPILSSSKARTEFVSSSSRCHQVVHIATSPTIRKQILRELQIMHECSSPFIVSFYGAYLADPHICMCMEFMDKGFVFPSDLRPLERYAYLNSL